MTVEVNSWSIYFSARSTGDGGGGTFSRLLQRSYCFINRKMVKFHFMAWNSFLHGLSAAVIVRSDVPQWDAPFLLIGLHTFFERSLLSVERLLAFLQFWILDHFRMTWIRHKNEKARSSEIELHYSGGYLVAAIQYFNHYTQWTPLVCWVFTNGSIPGRVIPKTLKMVLDTSLLITQQYKVVIEGRVEQSRERSSALSYTSV